MLYFLFIFIASLLKNKIVILSVYLVHGYLKLRFTFFELSKWTVSVISSRATYSQRERGQWAVYYTSPKRFIMTISYSLAWQLLGLLLNVNWLIH